MPVEKQYLAAIDRMVGLMIDIEDAADDLPQVGGVHLIDEDNVSDIEKVCGLLRQAKTALGG